MCVCKKYSDRDQARLRRPIRLEMAAEKRKRLLFAKVKKWKKDLCFTLRRHLHLFCWPFFNFYSVF